MYVITIDSVNGFMLLRNVTKVGKWDTDLRETARRHLIGCDYYTRNQKKIAFSDEAFGSRK